MPGYLELQKLPPLVTQNQEGKSSRSGQMRTIQTSKARSLPRNRPRGSARRNAILMMAQEDSWLEAAAAT